MITDYVFDPIFEVLHKQKQKRPTPISWRCLNFFSEEWRLCELCWRSTEYAVTLDTPVVVEPLGRGNAKLIPISDGIRAEAQRIADTLVDRYRRALNGEFGAGEAKRMFSQYFVMHETDGDRSVEVFRDQVERLALLGCWAREGKLVQRSRLPNQAINAPKPSKHYCEFHNPRRSVEARRAYQRDRRFSFEYDQIVRMVQLALVDQLPSWSLESIATARREAYLLLQAYKSPTKLIDDAVAGGAKTQAEIAAVLGVSQQAVFKALKRRREKPKKDDLQLRSNFFVPVTD